MTEESTYAWLVEVGVCTLIYVGETGLKMGMVYCVGIVIVQQNMERCVHIK